MYLEFDYGAKLSEIVLRATHLWMLMAQLKPTPRSVLLLGRDMTSRRELGMW